ncbi:cell division protein ZapB [Actinobacillus pleuropneumoniae]|uniref:cell division protein ZapB n=1 Tax=Actinobacillus pleuropneumoniae TaxID=715 RepID=UPI00384FE69B
MKFTSKNRCTWFDNSREKNTTVEQEKETLRQEYEQLKSEQQSFQDRLRSLLGQIDNV